MKKLILLFALISNFCFSQSTITPGKNGGTGVANTGKTITLGSSINYPSDASGFLKNNGSGTLTWDVGTGTFIPLAGTKNASPVIGLIELRPTTFNNTFIVDTTGNGIWIGYGNRKDIQNNATKYAAVLFSGGTRPSFDLEASDATYDFQMSTNNTSIFMRGGSISSFSKYSISNLGVMNTISTYTNFAGDQYESGTSAYMHSNYNVYTKPDVGLTNILYAPISYSTSATNATAPLSITTNTISIPAAATAQNGYLTSTDWNTFNNKASSSATFTVNGTAMALGTSSVVTAAAGTLTGTALNSTVVTSSLTTAGTFTTGTWSSTIGSSATGTTQSAGDNSTKIATTAYVDSIATASLTLTNKRITSRVVTAVSTATLTVNGDITDLYTITSQSVALTIAAPSGTPTEGQQLMLRIKDNATARALTFTTGSNGFRASSSLAFPTTTTISKTMYLGFIWNATDSRWDMVAYLDNF